MGVYDKGYKKDEWNTWYENRQLSSKGEYAGGFMHGRWEFWDKDGTRRFNGEYQYSTPNDDPGSGIISMLNGVIFNC